MAKLYKEPIFLQVSLDVTNWPISWLIRVEMRHVFPSSPNPKRFDTLRMKGIPLGKSLESKHAFLRLHPDLPPLSFLPQSRTASTLYMRKTLTLNQHYLLHRASSTQSSCHTKITHNNFHSHRSTFLLRQHCPFYY
jgi:hypothetical protein